MTLHKYIRQVQSTIQETQNDYSNGDYVSCNLMLEMTKVKVQERSIKFGATHEKNASG